MGPCKDSGCCPACSSSGSSEGRPHTPKGPAPPRITSRSSFSERMAPAKASPAVRPSGPLIIPVAQRSSMAWSFLVLSSLGRWGAGRNQGGQQPFRRAGTDQAAIRQGVGQRRLSAMRAFQRLTQGRGRGRGRVHDGSSFIGASERPGRGASGPEGTRGHSGMLYGRPFSLACRVATSRFPWRACRTGGGWACCRRGRDCADRLRHPRLGAGHRACPGVDEGRHKDRAQRAH